MTRLSRLRLALLSCGSLAAFGLPASAQESSAPEGPVQGAPPAAIADPAPAPAIPEVWSPTPIDAQGRSAYGLYLAGRLALSRGQSETGADLLSDAEGLTPEQPRVREQAFISSLLAGDLTYAARITPTGDAVLPVISEAGRLTDAVQTFAAGDADAAYAALKARPIEPPHDLAGQYLAPWLAAAAGDQTAAVVPPPTGMAEPSSLFMRHHRALLLEHFRRNEEADTEFKALMATAFGARLFPQSYGEFLERRGRSAEALALYEGAIAAGVGDPALTAGRARIQARGRAPAAPTLREGAAGALTIAALQIEEAGSDEFAVVYLRLALSLDPQEATLFRLGQTLAAAKLEAAARDALGRIGSGQPDIYAQARIEIARSLAREGQTEAALTEFRRAAAAAPDQPAAGYLLAAQLVDLRRYDEAIAILDSPLLNGGTQPFEFLFLRGAAYEAAGRIDDAEAQLWAALQLKPNDASTLNYLGYLWVDSGRRVQQGAELIARAHAAQPNDGNIQDSLGWSQYRQGLYDTAVDTLEEAVAKQPANPEINDHLGDAYWQVGRRREAGYQWNRVLTLDPDAGRRAEVEQKLAAGLPAQTPVSGSQP